MPCPEPAGGWPRQPADPSRLIGALDAAVQAHPDTYNGPWVRYPYGWHLQDTSDRKGTEVYVVGTTGDLEAARRELARGLPGRAPLRDPVRLEQGRDGCRAAGSSPAPRRRRPASPAATAELLDDRVVADLVVLDERGQPVPRRGGRRPGHAAIRCCDDGAADGQTSMTVGMIIGRRR